MKKRIWIFCTAIVLLLAFSAVAFADLSDPVPPSGDNALVIGPGNGGNTGSSNQGNSGQQQSKPTTAPSGGSGTSASDGSTGTADAPSGGTVEPREDGMEAPDSGSVSDGAAATAAPEKESVSSENTHPSAEPAASEAPVATDTPAATEAPASVPEAQANAQSGMTVWGIVLIAVGGAAVGAGIVFLIMRKR